MTTTVLEIPLTPETAQTLVVDLSGVSYTLTLRYNQFAQIWTLSLATSEGVDLLTGVDLVTGVDVLSQHRHLGIPGQLVAATDYDTDATPQFENLGIAGRLFYITED